MLYKVAAYHGQVALSARSNHGLSEFELALIERIFSHTWHNLDRTNAADTVVHNLRCSELPFEGN